MCIFTWMPADSKYDFKYIYPWTSLAVQWLKVCFCCRGRGFKPWSETEILHAVWQSQKTKHALDLKNLKKKKNVIEELKKFGWCLIITRRSQSLWISVAFCLCLSECVFLWVSVSHMLPLSPAHFLLFLFSLASPIFLSLPFLGSFLSTFVSSSPYKCCPSDSTLLW